MYKVPEEFIQRYREQDARRLPALLDTICPHCALPVAFSLPAWQAGPEGDTRISASRCAHCDGQVSLFYVPEMGDTPSAPASYSLYMHPAPRFLRRPLEDLHKVREFDVALQRAYAAAINVYNAREWVGTSVVCRRALEDIAKALLPEDRHRLHLGLQIQALAKRKDLAEPILTLAETLKRNGGLNAYFDLEEIPDQRAATYIVELLNYLIEYLFILPTRIQELRDRIEGE